MIRLEPTVLHVNGVLKTRIIARDDEGRIIEAEVLTVESSRGRKAFAQRLADATGESVDVIERMLLDLLNQKTETPGKPSAAALLAGMSAEVRKDAQDLLRRTTLIDEIKEDIRRLGVVGDGMTALGIYLTGTSRLLERPLAAIVRGASSSGKSFEIKRVAMLFPGECKLEAHHLSAKALYYLPDDALQHKFVIGGERSRRQDDDSADATKALREMISDGVLRSAVTERVGDRLQTVQYEKQGPIAFVESTSAASIFAEDLNRCIVFNVDESSQQTTRIVQAEAAAAAAAFPPGISDMIAEVHWAMQRMLQPLRVVIPFAPALAKSLPTAKVEARRAMSHLLNTIRAVALLRQFRNKRATE